MSPGTEITRPINTICAIFAPVGALLFDHPDPSIFTALTAPSGETGVANVDFAIFSERWQVAEHTFRPPWYHVNVMSEFMGLVRGRYDAKPKGFAPGGMSLHNAMTPHGPDAAAFDRATRAELKPERLADTLAFMFESRLPQHLTPYAAELATLQEDYADCWSGFRKRFNGAPSGQPEMKLASLKQGRDGRLVVVSRDLARAADASDIAGTMQGALDDWANAAPRLAERAARLEAGTVADFAFRAEDCAAPLPRAYQWADGSAYVNHVELVRKARGATMPPTFWSDPLMYQGGSDGFLGPREEIPLPDERSVSISRPRLPW